jgi:hypothetical protein
MKSGLQWADLDRSDKLEIRTLYSATFNDKERISGPR